MIKSIQSFVFLTKTVRISISNGIHTDTTLLAKARKNAVRAIPHEPGIRHRQDFLLEDDDFINEFDEYEMDNRLDKMHAGRTFEENAEELNRKKLKVQKVILTKKFFQARPQPHTLTHNERLCIKYLHQEDPIQWNVKTLSEGFPATPEIIKKVLKSNVNYTPEQAKALDLKVQKNWELLAEGKLDADPDLIEHLKKFINKREVLLEQIKNEKFYLPEVKKEPVWNQGEMNNILTQYEKALEKLVKKSEEENLKMLSDGVSKSKERSSLDLVHKKIEESLNHKDLESKDSFVLGEFIKTYSKDTTFDEFQKTILRKADRKKKLSLMEKAILEDKLNTTTEESFYENKSASTIQEESMSITNENLKPKKEKEAKNDMEVTIENNKFKEIELYTKPDVVLPDQRTQFTDETGIGKLLNKTNEESLSENDSNTDTEVKKTKAIDFSDPERLKREALYYDNEVNDIKDTSFWNIGRKSDIKAMAEYRKPRQEKPTDVVETNPVEKSHVFCSEPYPERIKIPKKMQGKGSIFKVKDCYYDVDGEFLYRVPGMCK